MELGPFLLFNARKTQLPNMKMAFPCLGRLWVTAAASLNLSCFCLGQGPAAAGGRCGGLPAAGCKGSGSRHRQASRNVVSSGEDLMPGGPLRKLS